MQACHLAKLGRQAQNQQVQQQHRHMVKAQQQNKLRKQVTQHQQSQQQKYWVLQQLLQLTVAWLVLWRMKTAEPATALTLKKAATPQTDAAKVDTAAATMPQLAAEQAAVEGLDAAVLEASMVTPVQNVNSSSQAAFARWMQQMLSLKQQQAWLAMLAFSAVMPSNMMYCWCSVQVIKRVDVMSSAAPAASICARILVHWSCAVLEMPCMVGWCAKTGEVSA